MIRLSQRAWNNVIIVSMIMLIMLFNFSSNFLNGGGDDTSSLNTLVPSNMAITTMEFERAKVERIGQGWRISEKYPRKSGEKYNNDELATLVEHWNNAQINLYDQHPSWPSTTSTVKLWFAGEALPIEYQFVQLTDKTLVKINKKTYQLISPSYQMLTLSE